MMDKRRLPYSYVAAGDNYKSEATSQYYTHASAPRRRRSVYELERHFACPEPNCTRRYEAWRSLQYHLKRNHGITVRKHNGRVELLHVEGDIHSADFKHLENILNAMSSLKSPPGMTRQESLVSVDDYEGVEPVRRQSVAGPSSLRSPYTSIDSSHVSPMLLRQSASVGKLRLSPEGNNFPYEMYPSSLSPTDNYQAIYPAVGQRSAGSISGPFSSMSFQTSPLQRSPIDTTSSHNLFSAANPENRLLQEHNVNPSWPHASSEMWSQGAPAPPASPGMHHYPFPPSLRPQSFDDLALFSNPPLVTHPQTSAPTYRMSMDSGRKQQEIDAIIRSLRVTASKQYEDHSSPMAQ